MGTQARPGEKERAFWFRALSGQQGQLQTVERLKKDLNRKRKHLQKPSALGSWEAIGPTNVAGRASCMLVHPKHSKRIWLGSAGGGVWFSQDAGMSWTKPWRNDFPQSIGALAMDPSNSRVLYCGTGEANPSVGNYGGDGLYRSRNGGRHWKRIAGLAQGLPHRIGTIAVDPQNSDHLFLGGLADPDVNDPLAGAGGIHESFDGGVTWERLTFATRGPVNCHQVFFHPSGVFAGFSGHYPQEPLWIKVGNTWSPQTIDAKNQFQRFSGRISLAFCRDQPNIMYLLASESHSESEGVYQIYKSKDGGFSWAPIAEHSGHFSYNRLGDPYETQMNYNNTIAVHPKDPNQVIWGGVDLHMSFDGGLSWELFSEWDRDLDDPFYAHADHHDLHIVPLPNSKFRIYDANDGGLNVHENDRWNHRVTGMQTSMFYDLDISQQDPKFLVGGTQDNGTLLNTTGQPNRYSTLNTGDGGWAVFDPANKFLIYSTVQHFVVKKNELPNGFITDGQILRGLPSEDLFVDLEPGETNIWMVFLTASTNPDQVVTGSLRPWIYRQKATDPYQSFQILDGSYITAIHIHRANPNTILFGTLLGGIFQLRAGVLRPLSTKDLPHAPICRIASDPQNDQRLLLVLGGTGGHSHVFETLDGGQSWQDLDQGRLPDVPHRAIILPEAHPDLIFVANDLGVFSYSTSQNLWQNLSGDLPFTVIRDLVYHRAQNSLYAATYGNGLWRLDTSNL